MFLAYRSSMAFLAFAATDTLFPPFFAAVLEASAAFFLITCSIVYLYVHLNTYRRGTLRLAGVLPLLTVSFTQVLPTVYLAHLRLS